MLIYKKQFEVNSILLFNIKQNPKDKIDLIFQSEFKH